MWLAAFYALYSTCYHKKIFLCGGFDLMTRVLTFKKEKKKYVVFITSGTALYFSIRAGPFVRKTSDN